MHARSRSSVRLVDDIPSIPREQRQPAGLALPEKGCQALGAPRAFLHSAPIIIPLHGFLWRAKEGHMWMGHELQFPKNPVRGAFG